MQRLLSILFFIVLIFVLVVGIYAEETSMKVEEGAESSSNNNDDGDLSSTDPLKRYPKGLVPQRLQLGKIIQDKTKNAKNKPGTVSQRIWIPFNPPLQSPLNTPQVVVALTEFTTTHQGHLRLRASASFVNNSGFEMMIGSWTEPAVPYISASWVATDLPLWEFQSMRIEQHLNSVEWGLEEVKFSPPLVSSEFYASSISTSTSSSVGVVNAQEHQQNSEFYFENDADTELGKKRRALQKAVEKIRKPPRVVSAIAKFEQRGDAHWTKLDVQALSVSALGFTAVIRPWGDTPTFWVAAEHLATTLPPEYVRSGVVDIAKEQRKNNMKNQNQKASSTANTIIANSKTAGKINVKFNLLSSSEQETKQEEPSSDNNDVTSPEQLLSSLMDHKHEILPPMFCEHPHVVVFLKSFDQAPPRREIRVVPQNVNSKSFDLVYDLRGASESSDQTQFSWIAVC